MRLGAARCFRCTATAIVLLAVAVGCASGPPKEAFRLPATSLEVRELQTRTFEADEAEILSASVALLQDMEYNVDEVEIDLGVLSASKIVDADSSAQKAGLIALDVVSILLAAISGSTPGGSAYATADDQLGLKMTLVVLPSLAREGEYIARVTVQSALFDKSGQTKELSFVESPDVYQEIFSKLSKALFLETEIP